MREKGGRKKERKKDKFCNVPCRCMTVKNFVMTLELGRIRTWRLPAFSALLMLLRAS